MIVYEPDQPLKSIFNLGTTRHNQFMPAIEGVKYVPVYSHMKLTMNPSRTFEWIDKPSRNKKGEFITSKIG